jgi:hypothetical protein
MSTFQPSPHSYSGPLVRVEEQLVDPYSHTGEGGIFITESNPFYSWKVSFVGRSLAAAMSYRKNKSFVWALGAWLVPPIMTVPYYTLETFVPRNRA